LTDGSGDDSLELAGEKGSARAGETAADPKPSSRIEVRWDFEDSSMKSESPPSFDEDREDELEDLDLELESLRRAKDLSRRSLSLEMDELGPGDADRVRELRTRSLNSAMMADPPSNCLKTEEGN
jgi:hypothetical protein